jgi:hypothetical protein
MSETPQEFVARWLNQVPTPVQEHVREAIRAVLASEAQSAEHIQALLDRAQRAEAALHAAAIALENQAHAAGSWHEDEMRMDAAREAAKAARAALREEGK